MSATPSFLTAQPPALSTAQPPALSTAQPPALSTAQPMALIQALLLAIVLLAACDDADPSPGEDTAGQAAEPTPSSAGAGPRGDVLEMPPSGQIRLRIDEDGLTLLANAAPRRPLLDVLSERLDFELVPGDIGIETVTARIEAAHLREVLPSLLPDRAYRVEYRRDASAGRHEVSRLEIAPSGAIAFVAAPDYVVPQFVPELGGPPTPGNGAEAPSQTDVDWKALVLRLDDADAEERIEALKLIDPDGEGVALIVDRLGRDPDARVRAVAAERLEFADTLAAVDALVQALRDPDKRVILAAIDALELTEDYSVTEDLAALLDHPDEEIREAAEDAIPFIGSPDDEDIDEEGD